MNLSVSLGSESRGTKAPEWGVSVASVFSLLPWIAVVLLTAGVRGALNFLAYAAVVVATGYSVVCVALPAAARSETIVLAPATGIMVISALTAFWVRLRLPLVWAPIVWLVLAAPGFVGLWRDRAGWKRISIGSGFALSLLSAVLCAVYLLPSAENDMVRRRDGSFNWRSMDSQHFQALAASIKNSGSPPRSPGTATAELLYHFGSFAPAAAISRVDGLDVGDALARVTRAASLWALVLSCFGVGTLLSLRASGTRFGGLMAVCGLFFYGSVTTLFTSETTTAGHRVAAWLFDIPEAGVMGSGGPFDYLLVPNAMIYGLIAITAIMGLCLIEQERDARMTWPVMLLALPALAVPENSLAALYCLGVAGILLFWGRLGEVRSWLGIALMLCLFAGAWKLMGYDRAPDASGAVVNVAVQRWWELTIWFIAGLGLRIVGFRWIARPLKDPVAAMVLATVLGLLLFFILVHLRDRNEKYALHFLQAVFSIFALSRLTPGFWRGEGRARVVREWLKPAKKGMVALAATGASIGCLTVATHSRTGIGYFKTKILVSCVLVAVLFAISVLMKRSGKVAAATSAAVLGVLMAGFLAWMPDWVRYGMGRARNDITYAPLEVRGLRRLGKLMAHDERFATNKHALGVSADLQAIERSYGYSALSEHQVLLEGYMSRGETRLSWFPTLLHDNDAMFTTKDAEMLHDLAKKWQVNWLVARPGTDIALPRPLPGWLVEQQDSGNLKIYRIN